MVKMPRFPRRSNDEYESNLPRRAPWRKKRHHSKGKEPVPSNRSTASENDATFTGDTQLSAGDLMAMDLDSPRGLGASEAMDFAYAAPRTGEPGPSNWPGRPKTPLEAPMTVDPKNLMKAIAREVDDEDAMEVDRLVSSPELDASTILLGSVPSMKSQMRMKKDKKQAAQDRNGTDRTPEAEKRATPAKKEVSVEDFDSMKPAERAKLKPKRVNSDSFYRGFSPWRNMSPEARADERTFLDRLMSKFSWPKSLKRSREVVEEPLSPRSAPLSDTPSEPKYQRRIFFSRSERLPEARASVVSTVADYSDEEGNDLVGYDSHELRGCDSRRASTSDPLPTVPPPALNVRTATPALLPAHPNNPTSPTSPNQPTPDSARPRLSYPSRQSSLSQAQAAGFEKMSSGKPVSEGGKGVEVEMYRTSSWGVDVLVPV